MKQIKDVNKLTVELDEPFCGGVLAVNFKLKRAADGVCSIDLAEIGNSDVKVYISSNKLTIGEKELRITSEKIKATSIPSDEWCTASIVYTLEQGKLGVMAVLKNADGGVLASVALSELVRVTVMNFTKIELQNFGLEAPWCLKELTAQINPLSTGYVFSAEREVITTENQYSFNFLSIGGFHTIRPYFGDYAFLPDNSGMICGTADGCFYRYDFATEKLTYLDRTALAVTHLGSEFSSAKRLHVSLNPATGNVFYFRINERGNKVLCKINPTTLEKAELYEITDSAMEVQLTTTDDEKYTSYQIGGMANGGVEMQIGRLDLTKGEIDVSKSVTFDEWYAVNHVIINPIEPDLILFHREYDDTYLLNLQSGKITTYERKGEKSTHAIWTYGGKYITVTEFIFGIIHFTVLDTELNRISSTPMPQGAHAMSDELLTWVIGDDNGVTFKNIKTENTYYIATSADNGAPRNPLNDPFHGHPEMSREGKLCSWGYRDANGVLGVAWMKNFDFS